MNPQSSLPLISVGIPTYNRSRGLADAVASVQRQGYSRLEILISDNTSTDDTPEVCRQLAERDGRIRYFRQPKNLGPLPNFAFLLEKSAGAYFIWVADDDTLEPDILDRCLNFIGKHPDYVLVGGTVRYWDQGSIFMEEKGFTFTQEDPEERVAAFYRKVAAGGIFHGLMRRDVAARIQLKNLIGSDWCFVSALLMAGKIKQLDFVGYNKSLIGLSLDFEQYAATVGATRFGRFNPILALAWHAAIQVLTDGRIYGALSPLQRVRLFAFILSSLVRRLYLHILFTEPRKFGWMVVRSAVKTVCPERWIRFRQRRLAARAPAEGKKPNTNANSTALGEPGG